MVKCMKTKSAWKAEDALINLKAHYLFWKMASSKVDPVCNWQAKASKKNTSVVVE